MQTKIKFYYGSENDFQNTDNAIKLSDEKIQEMIDDVVSRLNSAIMTNSDDNSAFCATGDTIVIGFAFDEDCDDFLDTINIFVCRNYKEAIGWYDEKGNFVKMNWKQNEDDDEYANYSREELIEIIKKYKENDCFDFLNHLKPVYNPRKEV